MSRCCDFFFFYVLKKKNNKKIADSKVSTPYGIYQTRERRVEIILIITSRKTRHSSGLDQYGDKIILEDVLATDDDEFVSSSRDYRLVSRTGGFSRLVSPGIHTKHYYHYIMNCYRF